jgi:hypothetical protein
MRGLTTTIILVLVLAGLGAYIYFVESERPAGSLADRENVFEVEATDITEITVTAQGDTTTLRKEGDQWRIVAPIAADADTVTASSVASTLASLEITRVVDENASDLAQYGLAEPRIRLTYKTSSGASGEIHIGDKNATGSDLFARTPGNNRVFLVPAWQETSLARSTFDLRDKRILHFDRDKADTIEIRREGQPAIVLKRSGSDWRLEQPIAVRADYSAAEGLLTRLSSGTMTEIVEGESPEATGLADPRAVIRVGAGSAQAAIEFGRDADGHVYARDPGRNMVFKVDERLYEDATKTVDDYRDKDVFEFRPFSALRIRITRGDETYEFQKTQAQGTGETGSSEKWQRLVDGKPVDVDEAKMSDLLNKLSTLRAQSFNQTTGAAGSAPAVVVAVSFDSGTFERVRLIGGETQAFAVREGEPGVAVLDHAAYQDAMKALDAVVAPAATGSTSGSGGGAPSPR